MRVLAICPFLSLLVLSGCGGSSHDHPENTPPSPVPPYEVHFDHQPLNGETFHRLVETPEGLYAATSGGVYKQNGDSWELLSSNTWDVYDIEYLSAGHLVASICDAPSRSVDATCYALEDSQFHLMESFDSGQNWQEITTNFGTDDMDEENFQSTLPEAIYAFAYNAADDELYAIGKVVLARSTDKGKTWQRLHGDWGTFAQGFNALMFNQDEYKLWYGGQGSIENSLLYSYDLNTNTATLHPSMTDFLSEPGVIYSVRYHPIHPEIIYASGEPGIIFSNDGGESWAPLYTNHQSLFYHDMLVNPYSPQQIFTASWKKIFTDPQPFILEISEDGGENWTQIAYPEEIFGGVRSIYADFYNSDTQTLIFGLYRGGVMKVTVTTN
ncbi:sialidase family protein [Aestuariibacter sp. A3R04]|uniref:WD40/YVTN/BNR-like repeat-containing protein n=1 Tax=Aestuariibacter sp. A3R04 TaxID=2841571 RepID=UPI001C096D80|nr:sialidase family protein [Aestuariibacter sp. A3R04]MBU3022542.1 glycoside hydrolase [Aestuariibacter sp. A3R04]